MAPRSVIIFGATGGVGSAAALKAYQEGAKVTLAMRDPSKKIPSLSGISADRVQADLTRPETIQSAVRRSGAQSSFIYAVPGAPDDMRPTIVALKEAGVEFVVLLSSFSVHGDPHTIQETEVIPYEHARVEIALEDVFGDQWSAVRPAFFSSNVLEYKDEIAQGEVALPNPDIKFDWISPEDIGAVIGMILTHGVQERIVPLVGPEQLSLRDALVRIGAKLGKEIKVSVAEKERAIADMQKKGIPEPTARWLFDTFTELRDIYWDVPANEAGMANVHKYTHKPPMTFEQWLEENKDSFAT